MKNLLLQVIEKEKEMVYTQAKLGNEEYLIRRWIGGSDQSISDIAYNLEEQGLLTEKEVEEVEVALDSFNQPLEEGIREFKKQGEY